MADYDYVIIGGGISGLYMAYKLSEIHSKTVLLLESSNRFGGRIETVFKNNIQYELGAARFSNNHEKLLTLLNELDLLGSNQENLIKLPKDIDYKLSTKHDVNFHSLLSDFLKKQSKIKDKSSISLLQLAKESLGDTMANLLKTKMGYDSEFVHGNAEHLIKSYDKDLFENSSGIKESQVYYILNKGLSSLIDKLILVLSKRSNCKLLTNHKVSSIVKRYSLEQVSVGKKNFKARKVICCVPLLSLRSIQRFDTIQTLYNLQVCPLLRIYVKYDSGEWFKSLKRTITDQSIRHIIPIDPDNGLIMISYTDGQLAIDWNNYVKLGEKKLMDIIHSYIKELKLGNPTSYDFVDHRFWSSGFHLWKPGCNVDKEYNNLKKPFPGDEIYLVNEAYSKHQGWIEGCLDMAFDILQLVEPSFKRTKNGGGDKKNKYFSIDQILDTNKKNGKLIILKIKNKYKVFDLTEWMNNHPGGKSNLKKGIKANLYYKDSNKYKLSPNDLFESISKHSESDVLNNVEKYAKFVGIYKP